MLTLSQGENAINSLIQEMSMSKTRNEAQTRFHLIDELLVRCLGWDKEIVDVEIYENEGFTDYELGKPRQAVLEAKREGTTFAIPAGMSSKLLVDIKSLMKISEEASKAFIQVQSYCSMRGVPVAIISNGHQYISFLASRQDGINVFDGDAIVFKSLEHMRENFSVAWQLLSAPGIKEKHIYSYLHSGERGVPNKLSSKLIN